MGIPYHRTNSNKGDTFLTYGAKVIILAESQVLIARTSNLELANQDNAMRFSLDQLEEKQDRAFLNMATYHHKMVRLFNSKIKERVFTVGDIVLRRAGLKKRNASPGKMMCN